MVIGIFTVLQHTVDNSIKLYKQNCIHFSRSQLLIMKDFYLSKVGTRPFSHFTKYLCTIFFALVIFMFINEMGYSLGRLIWTCSTGFNNRQ